MVRDSVFRSAMAAAAAVLVLVSLPAEAQWKWKDQGGRIQYSDLPPPAGTPEQDILSRPTAGRRSGAPAPAARTASAASAPAAASSSALMPKGVDPDLEAKRKKAEGDAEAKKKAEQERIAAAKAENCTRAQTQLRTFESGMRVMTTNPKGEREYLDDKQRAEETKRAKDAIAADCPKQRRIRLSISAARHGAVAPPSDP